MTWSQAGNGQIQMSGQLELSSEEEKSSSLEHEGRPTGGGLISKTDSGH